MLRQPVTCGNTHGAGMRAYSEEGWGGGRGVFIFWRRVVLESPPMLKICGCSFLTCTSAHYFYFKQATAVRAQPGMPSADAHPERP